MRVALRCSREFGQREGVKLTVKARSETLPREGEIVVLSSMREVVIESVRYIPNPLSIGSSVVEYEPLLIFSNIEFANHHEEFDSVVSELEKIGWKQTK